jgi:hypothetical protein
MDHMEEQMGNISNEQKRNQNGTLEIFKKLQKWRLSFMDSFLDWI